MDKVEDSIDRFIEMLKPVITELAQTGTVNAPRYVRDRADRFFLEKMAFLVDRMSDLTENALVDDSGMPDKLVNIAAYAVLAWVHSTATDPNGGHPGEVNNDWVNNNSTG